MGKENRESPPDDHLFFSWELTFSQSSAVLHIAQNVGGDPPDRGEPESRRIRPTDKEIRVTKRSKRNEIRCIEEGGSVILNKNGKIKKNYNATLRTRLITISDGAHR